MGRARGALAVVAGAWLGVAAIAAGGAPPQLDLPGSATTALGHAGAVAAEVADAAPGPRLPTWSTRSDDLRIPLAIALTVLLLEVVRRRWAVRPSERLGASSAWGTRTADPRGPPA